MERVVITGMGAITPVGNDVPSFWESLKTGKCGIGPITKFDVSDFKVKLGAEVKDFDPTQYIEKREARRMDANVQFAMAAAIQAVEQSGLKEGNFDPYRTGVISVRASAACTSQRPRSRSCSKRVRAVYRRSASQR